MRPRAAIVERLAGEILLMVQRAIADLGVEAVDVVLGGGMLAGGEGLLHDLVVRGLPERARPVVPALPPVTGAVLAALDAAGARQEAHERVRAAFGAGLRARGRAWLRSACSATRRRSARRSREEIVELEPSLLGCPGGRSLVSTYRALAMAGADLSDTTIVMMDEYVPVPPPTAHHSCRGFAMREIAGPLGIPEERVWAPDPRDPGAYDDRIESAGGIDVFLLASGASDGHVAFLPPGSPPDGRTSVVALAESTRRDNVATFPEFESVDDVPERGVSVGLGTIRAARRLRLVLHGPDKRAAMTRVLSLDRFDPEWPASVVHDHPDAQILVAP